MIESGVNGFLARCDDTEDLLARAEQLAKDPSTLPEIGRRAREAACTLSWERIADQIETVFAATIDGAHPARPIAASAATLSLG